MLSKLSMLCGILVVLGGLVKYVWLMIQTVILTINNVDKVMTNHIPHIYTKLEEIDGKLFTLARGQHEAREDSLGHVRGDRVDFPGVEPKPFIEGVGNGGNEGRLETGA